MHVVRDCPFARAVWADFLDGEPDSRFFEPDLKRWSLYYLSSRSNVVDPTLFAGTCWLLWKNRNSLIFEGEQKTHAHIQFDAKQLKTRIRNAFEQESRIFGAGGLRERRLISWEPPQPGWLCVNTDGSVIQANESTSCGGIIRGDDGRFVKAFSANLGGGSITRAELAGIVHGLKLAWEEGARKVLLQTDSNTAVTLIASATTNHPHYTTVAEIRRWLERPWQVKIEHVYREANFVADYLASLGHSLAVGMHVFDVPSTMLLYWLYFDRVGVQTPRLV
ncbi:unnamed protein product [Linum tenue]|uniref:RNase H type-1 domain-containing protein n=1 Tax=Linum tenue TaxID=586396 RepID=A0AAV0HXX7_9ROSI|nr:unnamed protein product [Linum tenue]